jgi:hypothetical protein
MLQLYQLEECSICLDVIEKNRRELKCTHNYHKECIEKWLEKSDRCPLCMRNIREMEEVRSDSCVSRVINLCRIRGDIQELDEEGRAQLCINRVCIVVAMVFVATITIIILQLWLP